MLSAGDVIVGASDAFFVAFIFRVDPITGAQTVISSGGMLESDTLRNGGDVRLGGSRAVPGLSASSTSTGTATVTIPLIAPGGSFYLLACADDSNAVPETSENDNCRASEVRVTVRVAG